jgi:flagellar basal-body rod protein FlgC
MSEISLMPSLAISASGLDAETRRMEVIANNVANAQTTRGEDGKVFRRKQVLFAAKLATAMSAGRATRKLQGVQVQQVVDDPRPLRRDYRPGHPDADTEGYVTMPNISPVEEMVDMMSASRAYEANLAAARVAKSMATQALDMMKSS